MLYKCSSKHFNLIAFSVDVNLLLRVFKAVSSNNTGQLEMKLSQKTVLNASGEYVIRPFLAFSGKVGDRSLL
jgi:HUS1 checkpoint protein